MKKIIQNSFLAFLFLCLMQIITVQAEETKSLIGGEKKSQSLLRRLIVSFAEYMALKEFHAFLPTKTSKWLPVVTFSLAFVPLILKIISLKKSEKNYGSKEIENFLGKVFDFYGKNNEKKKKYKEANQGLQKNLDELTRNITEKDISIKEKMIFTEKLESDFKKKESDFQNKIKDLKRLIDALSQQTSKHILDDESKICNTAIEKKHYKIEKSLDIEVEKNVSQKQFIHVNDINEVADGEQALYKYSYLEKIPENCHVFNVSTKNSSEYNAYKNYIFVIDQATQDAIANKIKNGENKTYEVFRHHAKSCIRKIKPHDGELYTFVYMKISESESENIACDMMKDYLAEQKKYFDFVGFFGNTITPDRIQSMVNGLDETKQAILLFADIGKDVRSSKRRNNKKRIKKSDLAECFRYCINIHESEKLPHKKDSIFNIAIRPFIENNSDDTTAAMSFENARLFFSKKIHQKESFLQYQSYSYMYLGKNGYFCYNVNIKKGHHHITNSIAEKIKRFSKNPETFIETELYMTLLRNTIMMHNLHKTKGVNFKKTEGLNFKYVIPGDEELIQWYKDAIPKEEQLIKVNQHVKVLLQHKK